MSFDFFDYCFVKLRNLECKGGAHTVVRPVAVAGSEVAVAVDTPRAVVIDVARRTSPISAIK